MLDRLSDAERHTLLLLARDALETSVRGKQLSPVDEGNLTPALRAQGASFVTLTENGRLRGCIGALQAYQSLYQDVCEHAMAAALQDYRFPPVRPSELAYIHIEVSRLSDPQVLIYQDPADLLQKLRPGVDGVILRDGSRRATFLPQVWDQIPDTTEFLNHLCEKMGAAHSLWRQKHIDVLIYQVEEFQE